MSFKNKLPLIILTILGIIFMVFFYGKIILHPNNYIFNDSGDAIKNYYTYYYHIANDSSFVHFEGMNYPYGEHYLYTDCHPVIANLMQLLKQLNINTPSFCIGVINFLMIISIFITLIIIYHILRKFKVSYILAIIFSFGITLLSPQIFRLEGHLSLSYSMAIPLSWLFLINLIESQNKFKWLCLLFFNNIFWLFIHAYLGVMIVFFQFSYWIISLFINKINKNNFLFILQSLIVIIAPLILFKIFLNITDVHIGRTNNPSGFFLYYAELDDILLPHFPPMRPIWNHILPVKIGQRWEAWSYIGLASFLSLTYFGILCFLYFIKKRKKFEINTYYEQYPTLIISLFASCIVLSFACIFPFKLFPELTEIFPVVKQFRATGRFTWIFYYVATVFSVIILNKLYLNLRKKNKIFICSLILGLSIFSIIEGLPYHKFVSKRISRYSNPFLKQNLNNDFKQILRDIDFNKYQAILPMPFYYIGSESFSRPRQPEIVKTSMIISAHSGLPITGAYLTRTSVPESKKIVQLISPPFYEKLIKNDIQRKKPFLIIRSHEALTKYEDCIIKNSNKIIAYDEFTLYSLKTDDLFKDISHVEYKSFNAKKDQLIPYENFLITDTSFVYYNDFEDNNSKFSFRGNGVYQGMKKGKNTFVEFNPYTFSTDKEYSVSAWMYNNIPDALNLYFQFLIEEYDAINNKWYVTEAFPEHSEVINHNWSLVETRFKIHDPRNHVYIVSKGKENSKAELFLDDLLIRESHADIYKEMIQNNSIVLFKNNHKIQLTN